jgi:hypothetical protein
MTITLTREEAQSVLDALEGVKDMAWDSDTVAGRKLIETFRARLAQPELEPDKYLMEIECTKCGAKEDGILIVNAPPKREFIGLTDEEISELIRNTHNTGSFVRAIEVKLKQKNA